MEKRIVIYDDNISFAERLMNFMETEGGYTVYLFTVWDKLVEYMEKNTSDHYLLQDSESSREIIKRYGVQGILLTENRDLEKVDLCNCIYRYKSASEIMECVVNRISNRVNKEEDNPKARAYAFVSPCHRNDLDNIINEMSMYTTKKALVLDFRYINFWNSICENADKSLSDLLYILKDDLGKVNASLKQTICSLNNIDLIFGLSTESDVMELEAKDIDNLIAIFIGMGSYERIYLLCDTTLLELLSISGIQKNIVWFTRGSIYEEKVMELYKEKDVDIYEHINLREVKDGIEIYTPNYGCGKDERMKELMERFVSDGIL
jgi:hypothetical protein